jgi:hypothetical protein
MKGFISGIISSQWPLYKIHQSFQKKYGSYCCHNNSKMHLVMSLERRYSTFSPWPSRIPLLGLVEVEIMVINISGNFLLQNLPSSMLLSREGSFFFFNCSSNVSYDFKIVWQGYGKSTLMYRKAPKEEVAQPRSLFQLERGGYWWVLLWFSFKTQQYWSQGVTFQYALSPLWYIITNSLKVSWWICDMTCHLKSHFLQRHRVSWYFTGKNHEKRISLMKPCALSCCI